MRRAVLLSLVVAACGRLGFEPGGAFGGDGGGAAGDDGGATGDAAIVDPGTCAALPPVCGPGGDESCCGAVLVPGGTFLRGNDAGFPATISPFLLDRFEVTVSRFRPFLEGGFGIASAAPAEGAGAHPAIPGSGWVPAWASDLEPTTISLRTKMISTLRSTYSSMPGINDDLPIVNASWFEAMAFCAWDGGRLPTFAEHAMATVGGDQQRVYPWASPTYDEANLAALALEPVGSHAPQGDGRWGHADLVGNADEWVLDVQDLPLPCVDCAAIGDQNGARALVGWHWGEPSTSYQANTGDHGASPQSGFDRRGFRCARAP